MISTAIFQSIVLSLSQRAWPRQNHTTPTPEVRDAILARLLEENGEVAGALRDYDGRDLRPLDHPKGDLAAIQEEIGDVLFLLARLAGLYGISLEDAARYGVAKMEQRLKERGLTGLTQTGEIMNTAQFKAFVAEVKGRGFTHVTTAAGPIALDEWTPYGLFGGVNDKDGSRESKHMQFTWLNDHSVVDGKAEPPLLSSIWEFVALPTNGDNQ